MPHPHRERRSPAASRVPSGGRRLHHLPPIALLAAVLLLLLRKRAAKRPKETSARHRGSTVRQLAHTHQTILSLPSIPPSLCTYPTLAGEGRENKTQRERGQGDATYANTLLSTCLPSQQPLRGVVCYSENRKCVFGTQATCKLSLSSPQRRKSPVFCVGRARLALGRE